MRNVVDLLNTSTFDIINGNTAGPSYVSRHAFVKAEFPWSGFFCGYSVFAFLSKNRTRKCFYLFEHTQRATGL